MFVFLMEDPTMAHHKISSRGRQVLIFLSVGICYKAHSITDPAVYLTMGMGYFISLFF